jgi:putative MATE family efflux protein
MIMRRPDLELDRRIASLAVPALGSIAAEPAYSLADTAIVGHLGRTQLGALAIAATALTMTAWVAIFLTTATTSAVAGLAAGRDPDRARRPAGAAYLVAAAGGTLVALLVLVAAPWVATLLGGHGAVRAGAVGYLRASAAGIPFLYLSYAGNGHLVGLANARTPLRIAVSANVLNVVLEVLLVYGVHLGLLGSAWGTVTAQAAAAGLYLAAARRARVRPARPGRAEVAALLRDGHRLSVRTIALGVVPLTTTAIAARLGPVALGGQQIAMRVWYLLALLLDALAVPAQVYVSSSLGAGDPAGAHRVGRRCLRLGLIAGIALGVVTAGLAFWVPALFTADAAVRHAATVALLVAALTQPPAALAFVLDGLILGISDYVAMRRAMILAIAGYAPGAALVLRFHALGLPGVWVSLGLWLATRAALLGRRWKAEFSQPGSTARHPRRLLPGGEQRQLHPVGGLDPGVAVAPRRGDWRRDPYRAGRDQPFRRALAVRDLHREPDRVGHPAPGFDRVYRLGLGLVEQLERGPPCLEHHHPPDLRTPVRDLLEPQRVPVEHHRPVEVFYGERNPQFRHISHGTFLAPDRASQSARPMTMLSHSSPLARRYCPARRPSSAKPAFRYSAIAASLCVNTSRQSLCSP